MGSLKENKSASSINDMLIQLGNENTNIGNFNLPTQILYFF